jgi:hypothetical protein
MNQLIRWIRDISRCNSGDIVVYKEHREYHAGRLKVRLYLVRKEIWDE